MVTGFSCPAAASTSTLSRRSSPIAASYSWTAARWAAVSPGMAFHLVGLVLKQHEIVRLVLVHPDDPGHGGVIEPARLGQGRLQQAELPPDREAAGIRPADRTVRSWAGSAAGRPGTPYRAPGPGAGSLP